MIERKAKSIFSPFQQCKAIITTGTFLVWGSEKSVQVGIVNN